MNKKIFITRLLSVCGVLLVLGATAITSFFILLDPNAFYNENLVQSKIEEDPGNLVDHYFEAECAEHNGCSTNLEHACVGASYYYDPSFGGGLALRNIENNTFTFKFTSSETYKVPLEIRLASDDTWVPTVLSDAYNIQLNNKKISTSTITVPGSNESMQIGDSKYFNMVSVELSITINKGDNELSLTANGAGLNLDYINIKTSAIIENTTLESYWADPQDFVTIEQNPTWTENGTISFNCPDENCSSSVSFNTLPSLIDSNYHRETKDNNVHFSLPIAGKLIEVGYEDVAIVNTKYSLTIQNGSIDGNQTSGEYGGGEVVNLVSSIEVPEGRHLAGWYDVSDNSIVSTLPNKISMPTRDIVIAPYFDGDYIATTIEGVETGTGKIRLGVSNNSTSFFQTRSTIQPSVMTGIVNGEVGNILTSETVAKNRYCIPMSSYNITFVEHTFEYTFFNYGENDITMKVYMVNNSSEAANPPQDTVEIVVSPGEEVKTSVTVADFSNKNILPVFYFTEATHDMKLGVYGYCTNVATAEV